MTFATFTDRQADRLLDLALDGERAERIVELAAAELGVDEQTAARVVQEMHDHPIARIVLAGTRAKRIADHNAARADLWEKYPDGEGDPC